MKPEIRESSDITADTLNKMPSPYERMIDEIKEQGEYYTYPEVCAKLGISQPTLRKAVKGTGAPSKYISWGKRHVWLFTREDVEIASKALGGGAVTWQ